jgi:hypothetical protein
MMKFLLAIIFFTSCASKKNVDRSYTITHKIYNRGEESIILRNRYISYQDLLMGFNETSTTKQKINIATNTTETITINDTLSIDVLKKDFAAYYIIDSFRLDFKMTEKKKISEFLESNSQNLPSGEIITDELKDTTINNIPYKYYSKVTKDSSETYLITHLFYRDSKLNTIFSFNKNVSRHIDDKNDYAGFIVQDKTKNQLLLTGFIENIKPLSANEIKICASISKKLFN